MSPSASGILYTRSGGSGRRRSSSHNHVQEGETVEARVDKEDALVEEELVVSEEEDAEHHGELFIRNQLRHVAVRRHLRLQSWEVRWVAQLDHPTLQDELVHLEA